MKNPGLNVARRAWRRELAFRALNYFESNDFRGAWRLGQLVGGFGFVAPQGWVRCSTKYGLDIVVNPALDSGVEAAIFRTGTYEPGTLDVLRGVLVPGDTFLDVGANVGLMSLVAAKLVGPTGQCHAFEPVAELHSMLSQSRVINGFDHLEVHCFALGSKGEDREIFEHVEVNRGSSSLMSWSADSKGQTVAVKTLDEFAVQTLDERRVTFAKIDVEGWELEVLKGGQNTLGEPSAPGLCVEYSTLHPLEGGLHIDLYRLLLDYGYRVFKLERGKARTSLLIPIVREADLPEHDNLFCFKDSQITGRLRPLFRFG